MQGGTCFPHHFRVKSLHQDLINNDYGYTGHYHQTQVEEISLVSNLSHNDIAIEATKHNPHQKETIKFRN